MSASIEGLPPVIASQRGSEQTLYLRASPRRRVSILCDYANSRSLGHDDLLALAVQELRAAYQGRLLRGLFANSVGVCIEFDESGRLLELRSVRQEGVIWLALPALRSPPMALPVEYQFTPGRWQRQRQRNPVCPDHTTQQLWAPTSLQGSMNQTNAQSMLQPQAPTSLQGSTNQTIAQPVLQQQPNSAVYDGRSSNFDALQQSIQEHIAGLPAASEQYYPAALEQYFPAASEQYHPSASLEQYYSQYRPAAAAEQYDPTEGL